MRDRHQGVGFAVDHQERHPVLGEGRHTVQRCNGVQVGAGQQATYQNGSVCEEAG